MVANPLTKLQKRKREILKQLKDLQKELDKITKIESDIFAAVEALPVDDEAPDDASGGGRPRVRSGPKPVQIIRAAKEVLLSAPGPMLRGELLERLEKKGIEIRGANPANTLGTTLSRSSQIFVNLKGFGYWLRDKAYAPADYLPPEADKEQLSGTDDTQAAIH